MAPHPRHVRWGDTIRAHYMAWQEDGTLIDTSLYGEPLVFTPGRHAVLEALESLTVGMTVGESKTEKVPPELAFGTYQPDLSCQVSREWLRAHDVTPDVGLELEIHQADGTAVSMVIAEVTGEQVTLDANHRLAGKTIILQVEVLDILETVEQHRPTPPQLDV
ncbi:peptidyl-prolyl cis-trans isomerase [Nitrospira sp.]|nr:peptidyl-prolyl cis-trans isomerase [Nitrospira sp.]